MQKKVVLRKSMTIQIAGRSPDIQAVPKKLGVVVKPQRTNKHVNTSNTTTTASNSSSLNADIDANTGIASHQVNDITNAIDTSLTTSVVCDGLHLTIEVPTQDQVEFQQRIQHYIGQVVLRNAPPMRPYRSGRRIYERDQPIGTVQFNPSNSHAGYVFLRVNPAKLDARQSHLVQDLMSALLDKPWNEIVANVRVSLVDIAVDVHDVNIADIIPVPSRALQSGRFLKFFQEGQTRLYQQGTEYIGHNRSDRHAVVYDKAEEAGHFHDAEGAASSDDLLKLGNSEGKTRIEVQFKPRIRKQFAVEAVSLATLPKYPNPLRMLEIAEYPKDVIGDELLKVATVLAAYEGTTAVLQHVGKESRDRIKNHLRSRRCLWWQPERHWLEFLIWLASHPLFAPCGLLNEPAYVQVANSLANTGTQS